MFVIEVPYINLDQIYESGQVFSWIKLRDSKYVIPFGNQALKIEQQKERLIMSCTDDQFYNIWFYYFDMDTDYLAINYSVKRIDEYMKICANRGSGVRILRQDLFEMIITFALATATNIPRIKAMVESISKVCGIEHKQSMREAGRITWYEFPTPQSILENQDKLDQCKLGYRKDIIIGLCQDIVDGWLDLELLKTMEYAAAVEYLTEFKGIGPKVAKSICLYGLHMMNSFPVDTHIQQMLEREFDMEYDEWVQWYLSEVDLANDMGYLRQVLFYNELNPSKEVR